MTPSNHPTKAPIHLHFVGIGGNASSGVSVALKKLGYQVTGSDENILPPADGILKRGGLEPADGFSKSNLDDRVELAVVGPDIQRGNPELEAILERKIPFTSWSALLSKLGLLGKRNGVVAGTDGKTTTASMWAWVMKMTGRNPDYVIGGQVSGWESGVRLTRAEHCILEGDEYPSGIGDLNPKFLHYRPDVALLTNIHFDHPDVFHSREQVLDCYRRLRDIVPSNGLWVYNADDAQCEAISKAACCAVANFGFSRKAKYRITHVRAEMERTHFRLDGQNFSIPQAGRMNAANAAAVALGSRHWGVSLEESAEALQSFPGAAGRQEFIRSDTNLVLVSDTAYHPNAVAELLNAMRLRFPNRRICLILQPRHTFGAGNWQQKLWPRSLKKADQVILTNPLNPKGIEVNRFSSEEVSSQTNEVGGSVHYVGDPKAAGDAFEREMQKGDVWILCLANWFVQPRKQILEASSET